MGENEGHTSVKVHAPPGGKTSFNIFGGDEEPQIKPMNYGRGMVNNMHASRDARMGNLGSSYQIGNNVYKQDGVIYSYADPSAFESRDAVQGFGRAPASKQN